MHSLQRLIKAKKKHLVVLSAGSLQSGISGLSLLHASDSWEIADAIFMPYPAAMQTLLAQLSTALPRLPSVADCLWLDYKCSRLLVECAQTLLARLPKSLRQPHALVVNKCLLYKGPLPQENSAPLWNWEVGDEQLLLKTFGVPVIGGFLRKDLVAGGSGTLPLASGDIQIAQRIGGIVAFVNIGLFTHMTIADGANECMLADTDCGPGTCLINRSAIDAGLQYGFDRDGAYAAGGTVQNDALGKLCEHAWFSQPLPRKFNLEIADALYAGHDLDNCAPADRVATMTALTARTIFDCFKNACALGSPPKAIVVSGGGAHNATLLSYLKTYFDPLSIESLETYNIGVDQRTTLALGLAVAAALKKGIDAVPGTILLP